MNQEGHDTIHSLVPIYAAFSRIVKDSVEGYQGGRLDRFVDIRSEAENAMAALIMLEKDLKSDTYKRRKYD